MAVHKQTTSQFIRRARVLFAILLLLVITSTGSSVVLGWKTGEFNRKIVAPAREAFASWADALTASEETEKPSSPSGAWKKYVNVTPTVAPARKQTGTGTTRVIIVTPKPGTSTYDQQVQQMNQWSAEQKAAQDAWWAQQQQQFNATQQQNQQNFDAFNQQAQQDMESFRQESQRKVEEFKAANGF